MALDVEIPEPPDLSNRGVPTEFESVEAVGGAADLRREELEEILRDGAWSEAFAEWLEYTDLTDEEFRVARSFRLFQELDIFWDPSEGRLDFQTPSVPADWEDRVDGSVAEAGALPAKLEAELADLGHTVVKMLEDAYVDWGESEPSDYIWNEETFGPGPRE